MNKPWSACGSTPGAPYAGTYAALGTGMIGAISGGHPGPERHQLAGREGSPAGARKALRDLPRRATETADLALGRPGHAALAKRLSPIRAPAFPDIFSTTSRGPRQSLLLLAPLAKEAGGYGLCGGTGKPTPGVFAGTDDPDYRLLLESVLAAQEALNRMNALICPVSAPDRNTSGRWCATGYCRARPTSLLMFTPLDRAYWQSHWHRAGGP